MRVPLCVVCLTCVMALAACAPRSTDEILAHHVATFTKGDWNGVLADYADDAVFLGPDASLEGKRELLGFFRSLGNHVPPLKFAERPLATHGDVAQIDWIMNRGEPGAMTGRDVFIIRHGQIVFQGTIAVRPAGRAGAP